MTNLNLSMGDLMEMPLDRFNYLATKLDDQRTKDIAAMKAGRSGSSTKG